MKHFKLFLLAVAGGATMLTSCYKDASEEQEEAIPTSTLHILTRAEGDESGAAQAGRIYIFKDNNCIDMLTISEDASSPETRLPAGTYDVYAVVAEDDDRYVLPTKTDATKESIITLGEGKVMGDLQMVHQQVTLVDGDDQQLSLTLERKVLMVNHVSISQVPTDVTEVSVSLSPIYQGIRLDGTYPDETEVVTIPLEKSTTGTWQSDAETYLFPSSDKPTITIRFKTGTTTKSFAYSSADEGFLEANHKVRIEGAYTQANGVNLSGTITNAEWGTPRTITFNFNDNNITENTDNGNSGNGNAPAVGSIYHECYVIAVNGNIATLASPTEKYGYSVNSSNLATILPELNTSLNNWSTPDGISGSWRIPTYEEALIFMEDAEFVSVGSQGYTYFCMKDDALDVVLVKYSNATQKNNITGITNDMQIGSNTRLRPVIDITL